MSLSRWHDIDSGADGETATELIKVYLINLLPLNLSEVPVELSGKEGLSISPSARRERVPARMRFDPVEPWCAVSARPNSSAVANRSAGTFASARVTVRSRDFGTVGRTLRREGTGSNA